MHLNEYLQMTAQLGASDLHLVAGNPPAFRIDGQIKIAADLATIEPGWLRESVTELLTPDQSAVFTREMELDFAINLPDVGRFRGNASVTMGELTLVFRHITELNLDFEQLRLPKACAGLALKPKGLVIVTGVTGSGKSTTLAAMVQHINASTSKRIVTLEDPIEYVFKNQRSVITQRQVGIDTHTFTSALSHVLRQNPDVIMVGEARDATTIGAALTASETGHLVLTTAHAPSAVQTVERIIDLFPPHHQGQVRSQLALILEGVLYQRLLPRADGKGRVAAVEVMLGTVAIRNLIREGKTHQLYSAMQLGSSHGMQTMDQALYDLLQRDLITREVALAYCQDPLHFASGSARLPKNGKALADSVQIA